MFRAGHPTLINDTVTLAMNMKTPQPAPRSVATAASDSVCLCRSTSDVAATRLVALEFMMEELAINKRPTAASKDEEDRLVETNYIDFFEYKKKCFCPI